jgi:hypothetical protein
LATAADAPLQILSQRTSASLLRPGGPFARRGASGDVVFIDCLGENVRAFGEVPFQYHEVTSTSGNFSYHLQVRPATPNGPPFFIQGQTSGKLFRYKNGLPANESFHLGPGEVFTFVTVETYVAEDGDRLVGKHHSHVTVNANGELTVSWLKDSFECVEK